MEIDVKHIVTAGVAASSLGVALLKFMQSKRVKKVVKKKMLTLTTHSIFYYLDELELIIKTQFKVTPTVHNYLLKQEVFRDIMLNKIRIWRKVCLDLISKYSCTGDCSSCKMKMATSRKLHMETLSKGVGLYQGYYKNKNYTKKEKEAIGICMSKFNNLHNKNTQFVMSMVDNTHKSVDYFDSFCPVRATGLILDSYKFAFYQMFQDVSEAIDKLNGDLEHLEFDIKKHFSTGV